MAAGIEVLSEAGHVGVCVRRVEGIVLIVVLERDGIPRVGDPVQICDGLIGMEVSCAGNGSIKRHVLCRSNTGGRRDHVLPIGQLVVEKKESNWADGTGLDSIIAREAEVCVGQCRQSARAAIIGKPGRHSKPRDADLLIANVNMLVGDEAEELVLDDRPAKSKASVVPMKLRDLLISRNAVVLLEEERRSVQPVRASAKISTAVISVGAR